MKKVEGEFSSVVLTGNALPEDAFRAQKKCRVERIRTHVLEVLDEKENGFLDCWFSDATRKSLEEAAAKF